MKIMYDILMVVLVAAGASVGTFFAVMAAWVIFLKREDKQFDPEKILEALEHYREKVLAAEDFEIIKAVDGYIAELKARKPINFDLFDIERKKSVVVDTTEGRTRLSVEQSYVIRGLKSA